jgi:simple sugar transport system ATP-binding protein
MTLRQMAKDGHAMIFISHKLHEVLAISDRITVLRDGHVVGSLTAKQTTKGELANMMVGRAVSLMVERQSVELGQARLKLHDLHAMSDRGTEALRGVSLEVRAGEILGLAGVSGNGQKELAEVITGLRPVTQGQVILDSHEVTGQSSSRLIELGLSYIPEERMRDGMIREFTVSNFRILREHHKANLARFLEPASTLQRSSELIEDFNVKTPSQDTPVKNLSGGNIQKLVLARELSRKPRVVVAAQPTRGLDIAATRYVHYRLIEQRKEGAATLLISEDLDEILALSDRIAVIYEGKIMGVVPRERATPKELGLMMAGVTVDRKSQEGDLITS